MNEIIKKNGIKFGIIAGIISILSTATLYAIDISAFGNPLTGIVLILFYIGLGVYAVSQTKKQLKSTINFKEAFTVYFVYSVIGIVIGNIFTYILFNFIDVEAKQQLLELTINKAVEFMEKFNVPAAEIKKAVIDMKANDNYSLGGIFKGSAMSIVISSIVGLIVAAVMKTKTTYNE
jgi:hypothetical protein